MHRWLAGALASMSVGLRVVPIKSVLARHRALAGILTH